MGKKKHRGKAVDKILQERQEKNRPPFVFSACPGARRKIRVISGSASTCLIAAQCAARRQVKDGIRIKKEPVPNSVEQAPMDHSVHKGMAIFTLVHAAPGCIPSDFQPP